MGFLRRVHGVILRDKVRSCENRRALHVETLLWIERSQLRWFGHVTRIPHERLTRQVLLTKLTRKRPKIRPRTRWNDYIFDLAWYRLGAEPTELLAVDREVFRALLRMLSPRPFLEEKWAWKWINEWMNELVLRKIFTSPWHDHNPNCSWNSMENFKS